MGTPLPTEARAPLDTVEGIHAALTSLGFDVAGRHESGSKVSVDYPEDCTQWEEEDGPLRLRQARAAHEEEHAIAFEQWAQQVQPQVVLTDANDPSAAHASCRITPSAAPRAPCSRSSRACRPPAASGSRAGTSRR